MEDDSGRFYKPFMDDPRGAREYHFYELLKKKAEEETEQGVTITKTLMSFIPGYCEPFFASESYSFAIFFSSPDF